MKPPYELVQHIERLAKRLGDICQTRAHADDWVDLGPLGFLDTAAIDWLEGRNELRVQRSDDRTITAVKLRGEAVRALNHRGTQGLIDRWT